MNSSYTVTDASAYSPFDVGTPSALRIPPPTASTKKGKEAAANGGGAGNRESFKIFVEPRLHGRRVDPLTRLVSPSVSHLPVEPHAFTLAWGPLTPELLAREAKKRSAEERCGQLKAERRKRPAQQNSHENNMGPTPAKVANGGTPATAASPAGSPAVVRKTLEVLHPVQQSNGEAVTNGIGHKTPTPTSTAPLTPLTGRETALVRLSTGKVVRVPMDFLRQQGMVSSSTVTTTATAPLRMATSSAPTSLLNPPPLRTDPTTLTKALERISVPVSSVALPTTTTRVVMQTGARPLSTTGPPASVLSAAANGSLPQRTVVLGSPPGAPTGNFQQIVLQNTQNGHQRVQLQQQPQQFIAISSAQASTLLQQQPVSFASSTTGVLGAGQRLVKIRAYPGPTAKREGATITTTNATPIMLPTTPTPPTPQQQQRLSQTLRTIVPVSSVATSAPGTTVTSPAGPPVGVVGLPNGATATPVRIRYIHHPNQAHPQPAILIPVSSSNGVVTSSAANQSGIKLSMALNSMGAGDRLIVLSPKVVPPGSSSGTTAMTMTLPAGARAIGGAQQHLNIPPGAKIISASSLPPGAKIVQQHVSNTTTLPAGLQLAPMNASGTVRKLVRLPTAPVALPQVPARLTTVNLPKEPAPPTK